MKNSIIFILIGMMFLSFETTALANSSLKIGIMDSFSKALKDFKATPIHKEISDKHLK